MLEVKIVCVGTLKESYFREAAAEYVKRLGAFCRLSIEELSECRVSKAPSEKEIEAALVDEGRRILMKCPASARVIALCIEGREQSSQALASELAATAARGTSRVCFVIGGSWGLSPEVKARADAKLSMSPMTFPHQLARVMLLEQIYRAFCINGGTKYHK